MQVVSLLQLMFPLSNLTSVSDSESAGTFFLLITNGGERRAYLCACACHPRIPLAVSYVTYIQFARVDDKASLDSAH